MPKQNSLFGIVSAIYLHKKLKIKKNERVLLHAEARGSVPKRKMFKY